MFLCIQKLSPLDEMIRQVTINCAERGLLLLRIRDEIQMTISAYQILYQSSIAFGIRKALMVSTASRHTKQNVLLSFITKN
jgi:dynein light intermediate chain